jgi:hypothetical protein
MNAKVKAVTAGQSLHELRQLTGTVLVMRSQVSGNLAPESNACIPKKYVLKTGVKQIWLTTTFVANDNSRDR